MRDITYDAADRITAYRHYTLAGVAQAALDQSFSYDELGRLTWITTAATDWAIAYDANGNRVSVTTSGTARSYTTAADSNRLQNISNPARPFGYDNAGNTTSDGASYTATYSLSNRLVGLSRSGINTTYTYDANGQRIRKHSGAGTVIFVYDQGGRLLGEYNAAGQALREYVWLGNTPIAMFTPDAVAGNPPVAFYFHTDHLNTPRLVVNTAGQKRWRWFAEPFGTSAPETNPEGLGGFTQNLRFPGQYADQESGLNYNYFRDYDASIGRYVQSDPIGLEGGINTYAYVSGNPLSKVDPLGLLEHFMMELNGQPMSSLECGCGESYPAFSGNPPFRNNPDATTQPHTGPAPEGWYYIVDRAQGGLRGKVMSFVQGKDEWFALYRDDGTPGDDTVEGGVTRRTIRLHPEGPRGSSEGCVTVNSPADFDRLRQRLLKTTTGVIPGTNIKYYGTILLYRPSWGLW